MTSRIIEVAAMPHFLPLVLCQKQVCEFRGARLRAIGVAFSMVCAGAVGFGVTTSTPAQQELQNETAPAAAAKPNEGDDATQDGKTVRQWISDWDAGNFQQTQKAKKALATLGKPAVPALTGLIRDNHRHAGYAIQTLAEMGPAALPALPELLKLARNRSTKDPAGWTWNMPIRAILFMNVSKMSWGAEQFIPLLETVGKDDQETDQVRGIAVNAMKGMGPQALPALRRFATSSRPRIRENAANAIVEIQATAGKNKVDTWQEIIDQNPLDSNVATYLANMKQTYNQGRLHPPTQRIKQLYRRELEENSNPQVAWQLAEIIRNGLANTDLMWASPADSYRMRSQREDPTENYETLASVLKVAHSKSEPGSELWKKSGLSLAKLRLLQGDWERMNAALAKLGQDPVPAQRRPFLPPPPLDWENLAKNWQPADEEVRSGNCGIEFRFIRSGQRLQGVAGVHVLVKKRPEPQQGFFGGIPVDTLFHATQPLTQRPFDSFGYRGRDRNQARYGVSNKNGGVRIEGLPKGPVLVEILVPTANFEEDGYTWDLLMATANGVQIADRSDPRSVNAGKPPALVDLEEGVVRYPVMLVRSHLSANVKDWDLVDKETFVLTWNAPGKAEVEHYNVKLSLSAPGQHPDMRNSTPVIATQTVKVTERSWPLGDRGVGNLRLEPGNLYVVEIDAVHDGAVVATLPRQRVWVAWDHRKSEPPLTGRSSSRPAFYHDIYFRTNVNRKPLEERLPALIRDSAGMYETEYNRLGMAWLDLHKKKAGAVEQLSKLVQELPAGNIVRATAQSLLDASANGQAIPRRLKFVAPATAGNAAE